MIEVLRSDANGRMPMDRASSDGGACIATRTVALCQKSEWQGEPEEMAP